MTISSYINSILYSYNSFFRLLLRTYFKTRNTPARLTPKRFFFMSAFMPALFFMNTVHWIGFLLDEILFPGYRNVEVKAPLFIVGIPRSGTSYTHRLISRDIDRFTTLTLWELLLAPSISERKLWLLLSRLEKALGRPVLRIVEMITGKTTSRLDAIHKIRLCDPEEDYFLLIPLFACYLLILPFPFKDIMGHLAFFDEATPPETKKMIMTFYASCLKRHLYVQGEGKTVLSKNVAFSPMVSALTETFPDCKILCNIRNPLETIPSHISSMLSGGDIFFNDMGYEFRNQMIDLQRYAFSHLTDFLPTLPDSRHAFLIMEDLKNDVHYEIAHIYDRFGYKITDTFESLLIAEKNKERNYSSRHTYSLASFGLTAGDIRARFADVFAGFTFDKEKEWPQQDRAERV